MGAGAFSWLWGGYHDAQRRMTPEGLAYDWHYKPKRRYSGPWSKYGIPAKIAVNFIVKKEGWYEKLAKRLGFATEFQTRDAAFDERFYIDCDAPQICHALRASDMRQAIKTIFDAGATRLEAKGGRLTAMMENSRMQPESIGISDVVAALYTISKTLAGVMVQDASFYREKVNQAGLFMAAIAGLFFVGLMGAVLRPYVLVDEWSLIEKAAYYAVIPVLAGLLLVRAVFHGSAHGVKVLAAFLLAGIPGLVFSAFVMLYTVNLYYDHSRAELRAQKVVGTYVNHGRRGHKTYYVTYTGWHHAGEEIKIQTDRATYSRTHAGDAFTVYTHPGYLGYEWIESYEVTR